MCVLIVVEISEKWIKGLAQKLLPLWWFTEVKRHYVRAYRGWSSSGQMDQSLCAQSLSPVLRSKHLFMSLGEKSYFTNTVKQRPQSKLLWPPTLTEKLPRLREKLRANRRYLQRNIVNQWVLFCTSTLTKTQVWDLWVTGWTKVERLLGTKLVKAQIKVYLKFRAATWLFSRLHRVAIFLNQAALSWVGRGSRRRVPKGGAVQFWCHVGGEFALRFSPSQTRSTVQRSRFGGCPPCSFRLHK